MRLFEFETPKLYHGTRAMLKIGDVLRPQSTGYAHGSDHEDGDERRAHDFCEYTLERFKPSGATSRRQAVYMCAKPNEVEEAGGYEDHIYIVEPEGPVSRCNLFWYSALESYCFGLDDAAEQADEHDLRTMAKNYWSAAPNDIGEAHRDLIEYLAGSARIVGKF